MNVGWNTTHLVVNCWHNWNWILRYVHVSEVDTDLINRWQTLVDGVGAQVGQVEFDVVFVWTTTTSLFDLLVHTTRNKVSWR